MYFESFAELLAMGRHGPYVWGSYAFFLLVLLWNLVMPILSKRQVHKKANDYWSRRQAAQMREVENETR